MNEPYWMLIETHLQSAKAGDRAWLRAEFKRRLDEIDALNAEVERLTKMMVGADQLHESLYLSEIENARLREALEKIAANLHDSEVPDPGQDDEADIWMRIASKRKRVAKEALGLVLAKASDAETPESARKSDSSEEA